MSDAGPHGPGPARSGRDGNRDPGARTLLTPRTSGYDLEAFAAAIEQAAKACGLDFLSFYARIGGEEMNRSRRFRRSGGT
jgi:hypothetical protein